MKKVITVSAEVFTAAIIFGSPFYAPWIYYAFTGEILDFGGAQ